MSAVLIGMMGVGKTTLGREAAARIGFRFRDVDSMIERAEGMPVSEIFRTQGEEKFRCLETEVLEQLVGDYRIIVSVGGGAIMRPENVVLMRQIGKIVYLRADPALLAKRLKGSEGKRPLLAGGDIESRVSALLAERTPLYEQADVILDVDGASRLELITKIGEVALLRR